MADDFAQKSQAFKTWLLSHSGASLSPHIELADYRSEGRGRGVVARADIPTDTELFEIDPASVLSVKTSTLISELPQELQDDLSGKPWPSLILVLIYEVVQGEQSRWWPYLQLLPHERDFDTLMYWTEDELDALQASAIRSKIGKKDAEEMFKTDVVPIIRQYPALFKGTQAEAPSDADLMSLCHRTASTIMAYAFDLENNDRKSNADEDDYETDEEEEGAQQKAMMPMADMLNADVDYNARLFNDGDGLKMRSTRDIKQGEEILNDFGAHPRSELLRRYGYVTEKYAKYDIVEIPLEAVMSIVRSEVSWDSADVTKRLETLEEDGIALEGFIIDRGDPQHMKEDEQALPEVELPDDLVELLHAMLASPAIWKKWRKKLSSDDQGNLRRRVFGVLERILKSRLQQYATTANEDAQYLQNTNALSARKRMAITVRLGEKCLLEEARQKAFNQASNDLNGEPASKRQKLG